MPKNNQINVRVNDRTDEAIQDFAEDKDYTKVEAVRRMVEGRLAGEGYLEGVAVSDGGVFTEGLEESLEETTTKVESTQSEIDTLSGEIEEFKSNIKQILPTVVGALIWIGLVSAFEIPSMIVVATGVVVILSMLFAYGKIVYE